MFNIDKKNIISTIKTALGVDFKITLPGSGTRNVILAAVIVFLAAVLSHAPALKNGYVIDDFRSVLQNEFATEWYSFRTAISPGNFISPSFPVKTGSRPLTLLSWLIDGSLYKNRLPGYHLTNILLHGLNSVLVFYLAFILSGWPRGPAGQGTTSLVFVTAPDAQLETVFCAAFAGLIFAVHPLQTEAVDVISFRGDLLACFFYVLSLIVLLKGLEGRALYYAALPLLFALGLLSKEAMISMPVACLLVAWLFGKQRISRVGLITAVSVGAVIAAAYALFWMNKFDYRVHEVVFTSIKDNISPLSSTGAYLNTVLLTLLHYARTLLFPAGLSAEYQLELPGTALNILPLLSAAVIAAFGCVFAAARNNSVRAGMGILFITYLPVSNILPLPNIIADRYMYLPMAGFSVLVAAALWRINGAGGKFRTAAAFLIICVLLTGTLARNTVFKDMYSVYASAVRSAPENARARYNLAVAYVEKKDYSDALEEFNAAVALNRFYKKDDTLLYVGLCNERLGNFDEAEKNYRQSALIRPSKQAFESAANVRWLKRDYAGARAWLLKSLEIAPDADVFNDIGLCCAKQKDYKNAALYYGDAISLRPDNVDYWMNLMDIYESEGDKKMLAATKLKMAKLFEKNGWPIQQDIVVKIDR